MESSLSLVSLAARMDAGRAGDAGGALAGRRRTYVGMTAGRGALVFAASASCAMCDRLAGGMGSMMGGGSALPAAASRRIAGCIDCVLLSAADVRVKPCASNPLDALYFARIATACSSLAARVACARQLVGRDGRAGAGIARQNRSTSLAATRDGHRVGGIASA